MLVEDLRPDDTVRLDADTLLEQNLQSLEPDEWAMYKPRWRAFYGTKFEEIPQSRNVNHPRRVWLQLSEPGYEASERDFKAHDLTSSDVEEPSNETYSVGSG